MSIKVGEIVLGFKSDLRLWTAGFRKAQGEVKTFLGQIAFAEQGLLKYGMAMTAFGVTSAMVLGKTIKVFADLEQSIANTASVTSATAEEFQRLETFARKMGETTIFKAHEAASAMYYLGSAGYTVEQIMDSLEGTLALAAATQYDLAETTRIVVGNLNAFEMGAAGSERLANAFAATISTSQATMMRLGESLKYIAPLFSGLGISLETTLAALGQLYNAGLAAEQAGTALRMGMIRLQKVSPQAARAMERMGLAVWDLNPQIHGLVGVLDNLNRVGAQSAEFGGEMAEIFGARAVTAWQVLARTGGKAIKEYEERLTGTNRAHEMMAIQIDTLRGSYRLFTSAISETAIQIGKLLAPSARGVLDTFRNLIYTFNALPMPIKRSITGLVALAGTFALVTGPLALVVRMLPFLKLALGAMGGTLMTVFPKIALLGLVLGGLTSALIKWATAERNARDQLRKTMGSLKEMRFERENSLHNLRNLISEYETLSQVSERTKEQDKRYYEVIQQINRIMPGTIDRTKSYADNLESIESASKGATEELSKLRIEMLKMREIQIILEMGGVRNEIMELDDQLDNLSKYTGGSLYLFDKKAIVSLESFNNILEGRTIPSLEKIRETSEKWQEELYSGFQDPVITVSQFRDFSKLVFTIKGMSKILADMTREGRMDEIVTDFHTLGSAVYEVHMELGEILREAKNEGRELTKGEEKRVKKLQDQYSEWQLILRVYREAIEAGSALELSRDRLNKLEKERLEIIDEIERRELKVTIELDIEMPDEGELEKAARKAVEATFKIHERNLEKEISLIKDHGERKVATYKESLEEITGVYSKQYEQDMAWLGYYYSEKFKEIDKWESALLTVHQEHSEETLRILYIAAQRRRALEASSARDFQTLWEKHWAEMQKEHKIFETSYDRIVERTLMKTGARYERQLEIEIKVLEIMKKQYKDYALIVNRINEEIERRERKIYELRVDRLNKYADYVISTFGTIGNAVGSMIAGVEDAWREALISLIIMLKNAAQGYLMAIAGVAAGTGNWGMAAKYVAAAAALEGITAATVGYLRNQSVSSTGPSAAKKGEEGVYPYMQEGGRIKKSGLYYGHAGEMVIPSDIVRAADAESLSTRYLRSIYQSTKEKSESIGRSVRADININCNLNGAMLSVNDKSAVDRFFRDILKPAERRLKSVLENG